MLVLDTRAETGQADVVYTVDTTGVVSAIDTATGTVVAQQDTRTAGVVFEFASVAADSTASPRLAVAPGGSTIYVADGKRIAVVKRQTAESRHAARQMAVPLRQNNSRMIEARISTSAAT